METTRSGQVLSSFDLSALTMQAIEVVTVDSVGNLVLLSWRARHRG